MRQGPRGESRDYQGLGNSWLEVDRQKAFDDSQDTLLKIRWTSSHEAALTSHETYHKNLDRSTIRGGGLFGRIQSDMACWVQM